MFHQSFISIEYKILKAAAPCKPPDSDALEYFVSDCFGFGNIGLIEESFLPACEFHEALNKTIVFKQDIDAD